MAIRWAKFRDTLLLSLFLFSRIEIYRGSSSEGFCTRWVRSVQKICKRSPTQYKHLILLVVTRSFQTLDNRLELMNRKIIHPFIDSATGRHDKIYDLTTVSARTASKNHHTSPQLVLLLDIDRPCHGDDWNVYVFVLFSMMFDFQNITFHCSWFKWTKSNNNFEFRMLYSTISLIRIHAFL